MSDENEDAIRKRAFAIWEAQGHPDGLAEEHWEQARAELAGTPEPNDVPNPLATGAAARAKPRAKRAKL